MASKVMTISRIFVLLWFTIFFETVRTTTPSAFTDANTSQYATDNTTENVTDFTATTIWKTVSPTTPSTFTDADTSTYATDSTTDNMTDFATTTISNNTTENVSMVTVFPATTISNNTTENVTMVTVFPAITIPNNTTENVTMATVFPATTKSKTVTTSSISTSTDADTSPYTTGDAPNAIPLVECDCKAYVIIAVFLVGGNIIFLVILVVKCLGSRKSPAFDSKDLEQPIKYTIFKDGEESALDSNDSVESGNDDIFEDDEVSPDEVAEFAYTVTIRHCKEILKVIKARRRRQAVRINIRPYENEDVLFDTCKMIKDWLDRQKCSNWEKRQRLEDAITSAHSSAYSEHDEELFSAKVIKKRVSGDTSKRVAVAYDLLMTDIKPFAKALDFEDGELEKYKVQSSNPGRHAKGTIGLVTLLLK